VASYQQVIQAQQQLPIHQFHQPLHHTQTILQQLFLYYTSQNSGKNADNWLAIFKIAWSAYQTDPQSLHGGYNVYSVDFKVSNWVANQQKGLQTLSQEKKHLLRLIGMH
jgi:hypothetical protein